MNICKKKNLTNPSNIFFRLGIMCLAVGLFWCFNLTFMMCVWLWFCFVTGHLSAPHALAHLITQAIIQVSMYSHRYSFDCSLTKNCWDHIMRFPRAQEKVPWGPAGITLQITSFGNCLYLNWLTWLLGNGALVLFWWSATHLFREL